MKSTRQSGLLVSVFCIVISGSFGFPEVARAAWTESYDGTTSFIGYPVFDTTNGILFMSEGNTIIRCDTASGCDEDTDWATVYTATGVTITSMEINPTDSIVYVGGYSGSGTYLGHVIRCNVSATDCDASGDWITAWNQFISDGVTFSFTIGLDPNNDVYIFAGGTVSGAPFDTIYRCDFSVTNCDADADWTVSYSAPSVDFAVTALERDTTNNIFYYGANGAIIYRCDITTDCNADTDWTTSYDTTQSTIRSLGFDSTNGVLYAGSFNGGLLYRCDTATDCNAGGDWTTSYDTTETYINAFGFDSTNDVLYAGSATNGLILSCDTTTDCDAAEDWTTDEDTVVQFITGFAFDSTNTVMYASIGDGSNGYSIIRSELGGGGARTIRLKGNLRLLGGVRIK